MNYEQDASKLRGRTYAIIARQTTPGKLIKSKVKTLRNEASYLTVRILISKTGGRDVNVGAGTRIKRGTRNCRTGELRDFH